MKVMEGFVENGRIRLREEIALPENTRVYVIVVENEEPRTVFIRSPRLADSRQAQDFRKQVIPIADDDEGVALQRR